MISEERAKDYFEGDKNKLYGALVIAVLVAAVAIYQFSFWGFVVGIIAIIAVFVIWGMIKNFPKDAEIDASFVELKNIKVAQSLNRLGITQEDIVREPLVVVGITNALWEKEGEDKFFRYNPMMAEIIHFGSNQLFLNSVELNLMDQKSYVGSTNEFFYQDISAVSIQDDGSSKWFIIKVHGETELNLSIDMDADSVRVAEDAVKTIRKVLREAKGS